MRDPTERLILLPFTAGCISESSIPVAVHHTRRSKLDTTRTREEGCVDDEESFSFQKLLKNIKNLSQLFVYKDGLETRMEIGLPTDVKHVSHIGLDCFATSILSEPELINIHSFPLTQLQLPIKSQGQTTSSSTTFLQSKCCNNAIAQS